MIWILDDNQGLAFEWNESRTVNVYDMDVVEYGIGHEVYSVIIRPTRDCYESSEDGTLEWFKESAKNWVGQTLREMEE